MAFLGCYSWESQLCVSLKVSYHRSLTSFPKCMFYGFIDGRVLELVDVFSKRGRTSNGIAHKNSDSKQKPAAEDREVQRE